MTEFDRELVLKLDAILVTQRETAHAMTRIAIALEILAMPVDEPSAPVGCLHPLEHRDDFGVSDGVEDWRCRVCGHRSVIAEGVPV